MLATRGYPSIHCASVQHKHILIIADKKLFLPCQRYYPRRCAIFRSNFNLELLYN